MVSFDIVQKFIDYYTMNFSEETLADPKNQVMDPITGHLKRDIVNYDEDALWSTKEPSIIKAKRSMYEAEAADVSETLVYLWSKLKTKEKSLTNIFKMFEREGSPGKVFKNKFWACLERNAIHLNKTDIDKVFVLFDKEGKGYFTF